ncbi:hypothetical protein RD792_017860 [Penstemon davidsonii]|uniref:Uncharacterized protein n=1 Tax=Penstemon davidsonii TaxID=160366 RepID=A0ABR0DVL0_9LAMI|nr:hypothetical protein RD792_017860 [Penstemon davidsonii]
MLHLGIEVITWCSVILMLLVETKMYVKEFRWYIRFGILYVLVGDAVIFNLILPLKDFYVRSPCSITIATLKKFELSLYYEPTKINLHFLINAPMQVLLGVLLFVYVPDLNSYPGYIPLLDDSTDENNEKPLEEHVCPERYANIFSSKCRHDRIYFGWVTPLMQQGYKKPITEKDVWKLDSWDQSETLSRNVNRFQSSWEEEAKRSKPWILRALNRSLGGRYRVCFHSHALYLLV